MAIIGTPRTGNTWIRRVLADVIDAPEISEHHPDAIDWGGLPESCVLQLHWPRTPALERVLTARGITVLSAARHPLDVLLSILVFSQKEPATKQWLDGEAGDESPLQGASPGDAAFVAWSVGPRARRLLSLTPEWWLSPATVRVRYEDLCADPEATFRRLVSALGPMSGDDVERAVAANSPARLEELSGGVHVWKARPGLWREVLDGPTVDELCDVHRRVMLDLGYDPDDRTPVGGPG